MGRVYRSRPTMRQLITKVENGGNFGLHVFCIPKLSYRQIIVQKEDYENS